MRVIRAAAVQLSPVLYSRQGTVEKVCRKIIELGRQGVQFATFPETVVPYYPYFAFMQRPYEAGPEYHRLLQQGVYGMNDWFGNGAQAEYCLARVADIARKPTSVDHVAAAVTPISALTAWQGLFGRARIEAGQHILIHGAAGSVGSFAVQFAHWRGARITATVSATNIDFVRGLGADDVIDYRAERFEDRAQKVDAVFDTVGGDTLRRSWSVLKPGGRLVTIAASEEDSRDERTGKAFFIVQPRRAELEEIARLIDAGQVRPVVGAEFPLAEAIPAYQTKPVRGKAVLRVDGAG